MPSVAHRFSELGFLLSPRNLCCRPTIVATALCIAATISLGRYTFSNEEASPPLVRKVM